MKRGLALIPLSRSSLSRWPPPAPGAATRRSRAPAARSSRRSSRHGRPLSARRSATRSSTRRSAPAPASPRSRTARSTSARRTPRCRPTSCRMQRLRSDPVGARRDDRRVQRPRRTGAPAAQRRDDREYLPRQDHELERPRDRALNPGANMPSLKITPVFRSDGSGTSYNFSDYLSASPDWKSKIGVSTQPAFPAGVGAKGSGGVAGVVKKTPGGVTYVDVAYAIDNHIRFAAVQNAAGKFLYPSLRRIVAAARRSRRSGEQRDAHRQPAEVGAARVSDLHLHLRHRAAADGARGRAPEDDLLGADPGPGDAVHGEADLRSDLVEKSILVAAEKTLKTIHT